MPGTLDPTVSADDLIRDGLAASQSNRLDEALEFFRRASFQAPRSGIPHFLIGAELAQAGRVDEAEGAYATAVLLAPDLDMARFQLGLLQFTSKRIALSMVTWSPLFERSPESALQRIVHGFAALAQDDTLTAVRCFNEGMALNLENQALNWDLAQMIARINATAISNESPLAAEDQGDAGNAYLLSNYRQHGPLH